MQTISYIPQPVTLNLLYHNPLLTTISKICQFTSLVENSIPSDSSILTKGNQPWAEKNQEINKSSCFFILKIGWRTGFRSYNWYTSMSTHITIEFGNKIRITELKLSQLAYDTGLTPFSKFRISFGDDGHYYSYLPEVLKHAFLKETIFTLNILISL